MKEKCIVCEQELHYEGGPAWIHLNKAKYPVHTAAACYNVLRRIIDHGRAASQESGR